MPTMDNWQRAISKTSSLILAGISISLFILYEAIIFSRFFAERKLSQARRYLQKSSYLGQDVMIEKSRFYLKVLKLLKKAIQLNPYDAKLNFEYAQVLTQIREDPTLTISIDITHLEPSLESGEVGFYKLAKENCLRAIFKEPTNALYHQNLGMLWEKLQDTKKAEAELERAVLLDPQNITIHLYLSQYFLSQDKETDSLYHLYKAVRLYKEALRGGAIANMVVDYLKSIGREDLI